ncbi:acyltransferase ChoActase/COT/CPT [Xylariaceae sp. FL0804]|nr:acyltransferase ChoActase/COT/CPT [Xylariaceae sp. FL0804]
MLTSLFKSRAPGTALRTAVRQGKPTKYFAMAPAAQRNSSTLPEGYVEDKSKGAMLRFQDSLPRLPVPTLDETAARYLKSLHPLLSPDEFAESKKAVEDFVRPGGVGRKLQEKLVAKREDPKVKNWIYEWWNDAAYLTYNEPVVPYVSYFYSHRDDRRRRNPAKRAAALTTAVLEFKRQTDEGELEPEYMKKLPICMDSYKWLFNACRIPAKPADYPVKYDHSSHRHIIAIRKNKIFKIDHEVGGRQLNTAELEEQFARVYKLAGGESNGLPVGALTASQRSVWADARQKLLDASPSGENKAALETIQSASFVVCLDEASPVTLEERAHQYWHGNGRNRWYDKPAQFIVNDNGTSGFMGEHSMMDGTTTHRLNDYVNDVIFNNKLDLSGTSVRPDLPEPAPVTFQTDAAVDQEIKGALAFFETTIAAHNLAVQAYQGYGKGLIKRFKSSPDAFVQMAIQLAYHKFYGKNRPTYESAATRRFQLGRTETCRSVSDESAAFCAAMADPEASDADRVRLLRAALQAHVAYIAAASDGKGVDRHLFGLRKMLAPGEELPALYVDPAFAYSGSWFLSTSQLSSEFFNGYGWSQVIDEGFGIAYMINENSLNFNIVSKNPLPAPGHSEAALSREGSRRMSHYIAEALGDMRDLLLPTLEPPKAKL